MEKMVYEGDDIILMQADNPHWKLARRFMHQNFMASVVEKNHMPLIEAETTQMIKDMIETPAGFMKHPTRFANSFMMSIGELLLGFIRLQNATNYATSIWNSHAT